jgi:hypothetical protein
MTFFYIFYGFIAGASWASTRSERRPGLNMMMGGLLLILAGPMAASATLADAPNDSPSADIPLMDNLVDNEVTSSETPGQAEVDEQEVADPNASLSSQPTPPRTIERVTDVRYPDRNGDQPEWLESAAQWDDGVYQAAVESRLQRTLSECRRALEQRLTDAADTYIGELLESRRAAAFIDYRADELRERGLIVDSFEETVHVTNGDMKQAHVLVAFDDAFAEDVRTRWEEVKSRSRLMQTGIGSGALLLLLASMFSYFRLDTATRGHYTGRLQFATAGVILAIIAAGVVVAQLIPWL